MDAARFNLTSPPMPCGANNLTLCGDRGGQGVETVYDLAATYLQRVGQPCLVLLGLVGNTLSMLVFLTRRMRTATCSIFLAALALVDNGFLLSLLTSWFDSTFYNILSTELACKLFVFVTYFFSFLSVWFIVGFTCERFFAICFPLSFKELRERHVVIGMSIFAATLYSFSFWTVDVQDIAGHYQCVPKFHFFKFLNVITWVDTCLTVVVPFLLIVVMNTMVTRAALTAFPSKTTMVGQFQTLELHPLQTNNNNSPINNNGPVHSGPVCGRRRPTGRVTRTMLLVSTTFLVLNLPSHAIRLYSLISSLTAANTYAPIPPQIVLLQEVAQFLYYSTFACNFFLYTMFGRNFKRALMVMMKCKRFSRGRRRLVHQMSSRTSSRGTDRTTGV